MTVTNSVLLKGLQPQPLSSYLAALGVLRISSSQATSAVRGCFSAGGFKLFGTDEDQLMRMLLDEWSPSPVLTPWNNASGFYESSKGQPAKRAMDTITGSPLSRFAPLVRVILDVRRLVTQRGYADAPDAEEKADFISSLRARVPDEAVAWIDAVAAVDDQDVRMMPVLGSGGNEGVLDYSSLFLRSIVETLLGDPERSARLLRAALFSTPSRDLVESPGGQFDPGTAGGFNTGPGFESKNLPNNPWTFMLLIEGTLAWVSGMASRQEGAASSYRFAVSPFTVRHRAAGYGSAGRSDDDPQRVRAETWVPVWKRPATFAEISHLIAEGRVELTGRKHRRALDSVEFAEAVASLGVARGIGSFVRYTFIKRRGESYIALPAASVDVHYRREADLLRELDPELDTLDAFLRRFPGSEGPPAQLAGLRRAIDDARFEVASRGGQDGVVRLVRAIGRIEQALARRDTAKEPKVPRPLGRLSASWVAACPDNVEVRVAAALASIGSAGGVAPLRAYLAPLDTSRLDRYAPAPRVLGWLGRDTADRLANVLQRRMLDGRRAARHDGRESNPTQGAYRVSLADVATFLDGIDDGALQELLFGFTWIRGWDVSSNGVTTSRGERVVRDAAPPLWRSYALLKLLFLPTGMLRDGGSTVTVPDPAVLSLLRAGRVSDAIAVGTRQLLAHGLRPRRVTDESDTPDPERGRRLAAALLIPIFETLALERAALLDHVDPQNQETIDAT